LPQLLGDFARKVEGFGPLCLCPAYKNPPSLQPLPMTFAPPSQSLFDLRSSMTGQKLPLKLDNNPSEVSFIPPKNTQITFFYFPLTVKPAGFSPPPPGLNRNLLPFQARSGVSISSPPSLDRLLPRVFFPPKLSRVYTIRDILSNIELDLMKASPSQRHPSPAYDTSSLMVTPHAPFFSSCIFSFPPLLSFFFFFEMIMMDVSPCVLASSPGLDA